MNRRTRGVVAEAFLWAGLLVAVAFTTAVVLAIADVGLTR